VGKDELRQLSKDDLVRLVLVLQDQIARLRKNSSTSSKPPSSDIVKPPKSKPKKGGKRKIGGQPGHKRHERKQLDADEIDFTVIYDPGVCPDCGGPLDETGHPPRVVDQIEVVERPTYTTRHEAPWRECAPCGIQVQSGLPPEVVKAGLAGPRLTAIVAYLKGVCHASYATVRKFLRDVLHIRISRGQLTKLIGKASDALDPVYMELLRALPEQAYLNVDETGHKENGRRMWSWVFRAPGFSVFVLDVSRGSKVLQRVLGEAFGGVLGSDYYSAYRKYVSDGNVRAQFCMAHLIRDIKYLTTLSDKVTQNYGERVLGCFKRFFGVLHRAENMTESGFERAIKKARLDLEKTATRAPMRTEAQNIAKRFKDHKGAYFEFLTTPGMGPTNNVAEQEIRHLVIDRKVTQGTRGPVGRRWSERLWTVAASCNRQGRRVFDVIEEAIQAHLGGDPAPSLLTHAPP